MPKENVLIINRMNPHHYYNKLQKLHIDKEKYNLYIFSNKNKAAQFNPNDYKELFSFDTNDDERLFNLAQDLHNEIGIQKVIALAERNLEVAAKIREMAGASGMLSDFVEKFRNKTVMKETLKHANIRIPVYENISSLEQISNFFNKFKKVVIKPKRGMGSENTFIIEQAQDLHDAFQKVSYNLSEFEIEEFIEGEMYHVDSIVENYQVKLSSVSKYQNSTLGYKSGESFLASYMIGESELNEDIRKFNEKIISTLELEKGVTHLEVFITPSNDIVFCEIGARAGGAGVMPCIEESYNINLFHAHIKSDLGEPLPSPKPTGLLAGWIIFYGKEGIIKSLPEIELFNKEWIPTYRLFVKNGDTLEHPRYSTDSIASFIITATDENELTKRLDWVKDNFNVSYE